MYLLVKFLFGILICSVVDGWHQSFTVTKTNSLESTKYKYRSAVIVSLKWSLKLYSEKTTQEYAERKVAPNLSQYSEVFDRSISAMDVRALKRYPRPEAQAFTMVALAHIASIHYDFNHNQLPTYFHSLLQSEFIAKVLKSSSVGGKAAFPEIKQAVEMSISSVPWLLRHDEEHQNKLQQNKTLSEEDIKNYAYLDLLIGYCYYYGLGRLARNVTEAHRRWQLASSPSTLSPILVLPDHADFTIDTTRIVRENEQDGIESSLTKQKYLCPTAMYALSHSIHALADPEHTLNNLQLSNKQKAVYWVYQASLHNNHALSLSWLTTLLEEAEQQQQQAASQSPNTISTSSKSDDSNSSPSIQWADSEWKYILESARLLRLAAEAGDANAQYRLGMLLMFVRQSVRRSPVAFAAANQTALLSLASSFKSVETTIIIPPSPSVAVNATLLLNAFMQETMHWYKSAAEQGNPTAMTTIGQILFRGMPSCGIDIDLLRSYQWLKQAANRGVASAWYTLGLMHETGIVHMAVAAQVIQQTPDISKGFSTHFFDIFQSSTSSAPSSAPINIMEQEELSILQSYIDVSPGDLYAYVYGKDSPKFSSPEKQRMDKLLTEYASILRKDYAQALFCYRQATVPSPGSSKTSAALGWHALSLCYARGIGVPVSQYESLLALEKAAQITSRTTSGEMNPNVDSSLNTDNSQITTTSSSGSEPAGGAVAVAAACRLALYYEYGWDRILYQDPWLDRAHPDPRLHIVERFQQLHVRYNMVQNPNNHRNHQNANKRQINKTKHRSANSSKNMNNISQISKKGFQPQSSKSTEDDDTLAIQHEEYKLLVSRFPSPDIERAFPMYHLAAMSPMPSVYRGIARMSVGKCIERGRLSGKHLLDLDLSISSGRSPSASVLKANAAKWYEKAAKEDGCAEAAYEWAICLELGAGNVEKNIKEAIRWYEFAAQQGQHNLAKTRLQYLARQLLTQQLLGQQRAQKSF